MVLMVLFELVFVELAVVTFRRSYEQAVDWGEEKAPCQVHKDDDGDLSPKLWGGRRRGPPEKDPLLGRRAQLR